MTKIKSFADLEKAKIVSVEELTKTLEDYSEGWAISARVVTEIITRTSPNRTEKEILLHLARKGHRIQFQKGCTKDARQYELVVEFLLKQL